MDTMEDQAAGSAPLDPSLAPALLFLEPAVHGGDAEAGAETTTYDDDDGTRFLYNIRKRQLLLVAGFGYLNSDVIWITPQGWVLVLNPVTRDVSLRDPFTSRTVRSLPSDKESLLPTNQHTRCLLSMHRPTDPGCTVLLIHREDPVLWYCSPGGSQWLRHDEYPPELIVETDRRTVMPAMSMLTAARGKFYTHVARDDKLVTLEFSPAGPIFSSTHVVVTPWLPAFYQVRQIESCGDLFVLRISLEPIRGRGIMEILVYKLVLSNHAWVKVDTLGDNRVFFFGRGSDEFGASMGADEVGLKANCIYFTQTDF